MTDLQQRIFTCLQVFSRAGTNGTPFPVTSRDIASAIDCTPRQAANSLMFMRGDGLVSDGSTLTPIPGSNGALWSRPKGPVRWTLK